MVCLLLWSLWGAVSPWGFLISAAAPVWSIKEHEEPQQWLRGPVSVSVAIASAPCHLHLLAGP